MTAIAFRKIKQNILDTVAFAFIGHQGPLGRWATRRVIDVWLNPLDEEGFLR